MFIRELSAATVHAVRTEAKLCQWGTEQTRDLMKSILDV
jgi:hypothetical protein